MSFADEKSRFCRGLFAPAVYALYFALLVVDQEGYGVVGVRSQRKRGRVVGAYQYLVIVVLLQRRNYGGEYLLVDKLYRALLVLDLVAVTALVGSFNVDIYKILTVGKLVDARLRLALEICVDVALQRSFR